MKKILDVRNLEVSFFSEQKIIKAVRGISFSLFEKQKLAIVGESGSGKSAAMKALLQLLPKNSSRIDAGSATYEGVDLLKLNAQAIRSFRGKEIGFIFQDPVSSLNPTMQVGKQLYEAYAIHHREISRKACYKKVLELLDLVGIPDPEERYLQYPFELSGGMCQRIMIALALAPEPKILIADEPTTAIDVTIQSQILSLLDELQQKLEMSIIFITHNLSLIAGFCDHALVIYAGKIVESASIQTLFYHPRHPYTKRLLASIPGIHKNKDEALNPIDGSIPDLSKEYPHCNFFDRCPKAMNICQIQAPPLFSTGDGGVCSCWLQDPRKRAS